MDFVLKVGERLAVVGANGSGKSTLLRAILGLVEIELGSVFFDSPDESSTSSSLRVGDNAKQPRPSCPFDGPSPMGASSQHEAELPSHFVDFAYVRQDPEAGFVCSSVFDEVAFGLCNLGLPAPLIQTCVLDALEACGIVSLSGRDVSALSGGQKQLVSIVSALALRPRVLLLDEPFCMLDECCLGVAKAALDATAFPMSIIEVTHNPQDVADFDALIALRKGQIAWRGTPAEFFGNAELVRSLGVRVPRAGSGQFIASFEAAASSVPAPPSPECLVMRDCMFSYGERAHVLSGVSMHVAPGELVAIVGESGSGKTTCACIAAGLLDPQGGTVQCEGAPVCPGDVGIAFQRVEDQVFCPTVLDDVMFGPLRKGRSSKEAQADAREALEAVGLDPALYGHLNPHLLSGGEKRRVALAGVLAMGTRFVILDEPTLGLDASGMDRLVRLIRSMLAQGRGILLVTHEPQTFAGLVTRTYRLSQGRVLPIGAEPQAPNRSSGNAMKREVAPETALLAAVPGNTCIEGACPDAVPGNSRRGAKRRHNEWHKPSDHQGRSALNPIAWLAMCAVCSVCVLGIDAPAAVATVWAIALLVYRYVGGSFADLGRALAMLGLMYGLVVASAAIVFDGSADLALFGAVGISLSGAARGALAVCRLMLLVVVSLTLVRACTSEELMDALQAILAPLGRVGLPVADICVMLSLALRCIPLVAEKLADLALAQNARGARVGLSRNVARKVLSYVPLLAPACIAMFRYAEDFAAALQTRGFSGASPTPLHRRPMTLRDWAIGVSVSACAIAAALFL